MINIKNLTKVYETINYNVVALSNLNFQFEKGEVIVILGRSGSGKSTFLNVLGGFDNTYSGSYFFDNHEFKTITQDKIDELRSKKIGFIFQHQILFNNLTVLENVELSLNVLGVTNNKKKRLNAMKALTLVGLRKHVYKKPWQLSGGEKQRVAIARAIVKDPDCIICDEPTAALDSMTSKEILDLLASVCKDKLLIIATHNKSIVKNYGTRLIELKSGYVVRDELVKADKSNIQVDELDQIIDEDLYRFEEEIGRDSVFDNLEEKVDRSQILKDLDLDLTQYKERSEETFHIDSQEKDRVIKDRKKQVEIEERFDSFSGITEMMAEEKHFARSSVINHRKTYLFLSFFLTSFLLLTLIGINLTTGIFMKNDNTVDMNNNIYKENKLIQFNSINETGMLIEETDIDVLKQLFIEETNLDEFSNKENKVLINDYSFNFNYTLNTYNEIEKYLEEKGYSNHYSMYYDPQNIVIGEENKDIIFDNLQMNYHVGNVTNQLHISQLLNNEVNLGLSYLYIENNKDYLEKNLIDDSRLPSKADEVLVSIETIINSKILKETNTSNVNKIYQEFEKLAEEDKYIEVNTPKIILNEDDVIEEFVTNRFKIVGLYNASEKIESYYTNRDNVKVFFSNKASDLINIQIENNTTYDSHLIPLYMEINNDIYEKEKLSEVIAEIQNNYLQSEYNLLYDKIIELIAPLEEAMYNISDDFNNFNNTVVNYPGLSYGDLLGNYLFNYIKLLDTEKQLVLCSTCNLSDYDEFKKDVPNIILEINKPDNKSYLNEIKSGLKNSNSLANELTIKNIFITEYWDKFNNSYDRINSDPESELKLVYENDLTENSYQNLFLMIKMGLTLLDENFSGTVGISPDISDDILKTITEKVGLYYLNPEIIIKSMSALASGTLVVVLMYTFAFIVSKLFRNIYQLFLINRRAEYGSLRILGAKFDDLKRIMKIEGRILLNVSYVFVLVILLIGEAIAYFYRDNPFVIYLYESSNQLFLNIQLSELFNFNIFSFISVVILMQIIFKKQLIDDNINQNMLDLKMLNSVADWDGE